ncbi:MAG: tRNA pseudouridine(55) synthase TruB [Bacteriovoracia bacterium]
MHGALLIDKPKDITSFGVVDEVKRALRAATGVKTRELPKIGHGGTLDPFATGLLVVLVGRAVKLAQYFLGSDKTYEGRFRFGITTIPGDPTEEVSERCEHLPASLDELQAQARFLTRQPYLQTPPMHSAKKRQGKPLYELARAGIEVEREAKACQLHAFEILDYTPPDAPFRLKCSSGTYVRTLAQDFGRLHGTVALLQDLRRTASGSFQIERAWTLDRVTQAISDRGGKNLAELGCFVPFNELLAEFARCEATRDEARALFQGRQNVLLPMLQRCGRLASSLAISPTSEEELRHLAVYCEQNLIAVLKREPQAGWSLEKVFAD